MFMMPNMNGRRNIVEYQRLGGLLPDTSYLRNRSPGRRRQKQGAIRRAGALGRYRQVSLKWLLSQTILDDLFDWGIKLV